MITTQAGTEPVLTSAMPALLSSLPITHLRCLDMSEPMSAGYNPIAVEAAWYDWWHAQGFFKPEYIQPALQGQDLKDRETFVIPSPPPNVTGSLHIGHALTVAIQDGMVRWNRMLGRKTLFAPGFDHAGISTQSVVEKRLFKTEGKTRHDLGRERFVEKVMDWRNDYQGRITNQLHRLGGSYDWDRTAFTMDEKLSKAVIETFCRLHEDGILYRANRLVNWCVKMNTTLSNLEVDQKELEGRTLLSLLGLMNDWLLQRRVRRLCDDLRYKHLHGKLLKHPFVPDRHLPVITDAIIVDMEFGTGAVKITPAHDQNDYEVGKRHNLAFINIMNDDGTLNANAGPKFKGMKRFHARVEVVKALKELGLYVDTKDNKMQIPICNKSGDIIEPILKPQWWVNCKPLADEAIRRTRLGELEINPKQSENDWYRWLEGIQDWCISRQLWWGHRCPAYFVRIEGEAQDATDGTSWVVGRTLEEARARAETLAAGRPFALEQDEDVLDTWFSSGLWPWSIMGWPEKTADMAQFYPASVLETGWDILFFWVARMSRRCGTTRRCSRSSASSTTSSTDGRPSAGARDEQEARGAESEPWEGDVQGARERVRYGVRARIRGARSRRLAILLSALPAQIRAWPSMMPPNRWPRHGRQRKVQCSSPREAAYTVRLSALDAAAANLDSDASNSNERHLHRLSEHPLRVAHALAGELDDEVMVVSCFEGSRRRGGEGGRAREGPAATKRSLRKQGIGAVPVEAEDWCRRAMLPRGAADRPECETVVATPARPSLQQAKIPEAVKMFKRQAELARSEPDLMNALTDQYVRLSLGDWREYADESSSGSSGEGDGGAFAGQFSRSMACATSAANSRFKSYEQYTYKKSLRYA
ncbi:hypothetical protein BJ912DRAFT_1106282 [Pholiota molesta]|nr:hypothetical protein BJ912DRAFT_1106282 [Pholiota molesta]